MSINVSSILSNPQVYLNDYNGYSRTNAYYNYYDEYSKHAHPYEPDYQERSLMEAEEEMRKFKEFAESYKKISLEEADAQIRSIWEKEKAAGRTPSSEMFFSTGITDRDEYVEKYKAEKEARGLDYCITPLTMEEEEEFLKKERSKLYHIRMGSYDFMGYALFSDPSPVGNPLYWIEGASFTKEEYEECCSVIKQANSLIGPGGSLDYMDYAVLGLAYNVVSTYAKENLTYAQSQVVTQSMTAYLDTYILAEQAFYEKQDVIRDNDKYHNIVNRETGGRWISATNEGAIEALRTDIFGEVDLRDQKAVDEAYKKYLAITGITGSFRDENELKKKISSAKAIVNSFGKSVDCSI
ncbi:MAG: hypothetical protein HDR03_07440 [Lachnospiraceae bacterium]|nr:hypothetical protein [Lachnospiraceae bacterium]